MNVFFKPSFLKDLNKLPFHIRREVYYVCTEIFPAARDIRAIRGYDLKPLKGFKDYYRIRLEHYRIGFKRVKDDKIEFMRVLHRKDMYRHFP